MPRDRDLYSRVIPFLDFCMAIRKPESASAVVIAPGHIDQLLRSISPHDIADETRAIDAVFMFIEQDPRFRRCQRPEVGRLPIDEKACVQDSVRY